MTITSVRCTWDLVWNRPECVGWEWWNHRYVNLPMRNTHLYELRIPRAVMWIAMWYYYTYNIDHHTTC